MVTATVGVKIALNYRIAMATCIYCGGDDLTVEHPLPRALGNFRGQLLLTDRVCRRCNQHCGQLDEQLCRSGDPAFFRTFLGVSGRAGHAEMNPFYRGSSGGRPLEMVGISHDTGDEKALELVGPNAARELRCARLVAEDGSAYIVRITDGMTPEEFRKRVSAIGIKFFKSAEITASSEEIPWVESLFAGFTMEGRPVWVQPPGPITYGPFAVKFTVTDRYFRAIAKIGFHYFLTKFARFRGDEFHFSDIRDFIMNGCPIDQINRYVTESREQFVYQLRAGQTLSVWGHILTAECDYTDFRARVQLFVGPESLSRVYSVQLGRNPSPIHYDEAYGDFFRYYPIEERGEFDGELSKLEAGHPRLIRC